MLSNVRGNKLAAVPIRFETREGDSNNTPLLTNRSALMATNAEVGTGSGSGVCKRAIASMHAQTQTGVMHKYGAVRTPRMNAASAVAESATPPTIIAAAASADDVVPPFAG